MDGAVTARGVECSKQSQPAIGSERVSFALVFLVGVFCGIGSTLLWVMTRPTVRPSTLIATVPVAADSAARAPGTVPQTATQAILPELIDVNRASAAELDLLPGIGPVLARRIIETRQRAPFQTIEELRRVPGIGPKTLERLRPLVVVNPAPAPIVQLPGQEVMNR